MSSTILGSILAQRNLRGGRDEAVLKKVHTYKNAKNVLNCRNWSKLVIFSSMPKSEMFMTPSVDQEGAGGGVYRSQKTVRGCSRR